MRNKVTILILMSALLPLVVKSQIFPEQVFVLGEHYVEDKCEVQFYPTWSRLIFLSRDKFMLDIVRKGTRGKGTPSSRQMGNYRFEGDTLFLNFTKAGYELLPNEYLAEVKHKLLMKPMKFLIERCGGKIILRNSTKEFNYGSRDFKTEAAIIQSIKHDKFYAKVREELTK